MKVFVLEDSEFRMEGFIERFNSVGWEYDWSKDVEGAIRLLSDNKYDKIFLDHDVLGGEGTQVAQFIFNHGIEGEVFIHSMNPVGASRMKNILPRAYIYPNVWTTDCFYRTFC